MDKIPSPEPKQDSARKEPWVSPQITDLPRLVDLTLQTSIDGSGSLGGGGSTVF